MIASCPKCAARYRIERQRIEPAGARLRCSRCQVVFRVRPPARAADEPAPEVAAPAAAPPSARPREAPGPRVLVATPNVDLGKETCAALDRWGFEPVLVHDGVEALLEIQRQLPRAIVVNADLPGMYGFQICELVKRNESLRSTHAVLIGAIHDAERYHRAPDELYGADSYLEEPDLPDGLAPVLEGFGLPLRQPPRTEPRVQPEAPVASAPPAPASAPEPQAVAPPPPQAPADDGLGELRDEAARLARIIVSDIVLYNAEQFEQAIQSVGGAHSILILFEHLLTEVIDPLVERYAVVRFALYNIDQHSIPIA